MCLPQPKVQNGDSPASEPLLLLSLSSHERRPHGKPPATGAMSANEDQEVSPQGRKLLAPRRRGAPAPREGDWPSRCTGETPHPDGQPRTCLSPFRGQNLAGVPEIDRCPSSRVQAWVRLCSPSPAVFSFVDPLGRPSYP